LAGPAPPVPRQARRLAFRPLPGAKHRRHRENLSPGIRSV